MYLNCMDWQASPYQHNLVWSHPHFLNSVVVASNLHIDIGLISPLNRGSGEATCNWLMIEKCSIAIRTQHRVQAPSCSLSFSISRSHDNRRFCQSSEFGLKSLLIDCPGLRVVLQGCTDFSDSIPLIFIRRAPNAGENPFRLSKTQSTWVNARSSVTYSIAGPFSTSGHLRCKKIFPVP